MLVRMLFVALCCVGGLGACTIGTAPRTNLGTPVTMVAENPGYLRMFEYVPEGLPPSPAMVVTVHHCFQSADDYVLETGWKTLADRYKFILLMPEQVLGNDANLCFTWWSANERRGEGAVESIRQMIEQAAATHNVDRSRVFTTGLSSGAGMAMIMLASHPELFAGGGLIGNAPFRCASTLLDAMFYCMPGLNVNDAQGWGDIVREETPYDGAWPVISVWHGDVDMITRPGNAEELIEQWTNLHGTDAVPDREDTVEGFPHYGYEDASGRVVVEFYDMIGMGHSTPVDPKRGCGDDREGFGDFIYDYGICSAFYMARFFGLTGEDTSWPPPGFVIPAATDPDATPAEEEALPADEAAPVTDEVLPEVEQQNPEALPAEEETAPIVEETPPSAPEEGEAMPAEEEAAPVVEELPAPDVDDAMPPAEEELAPVAEETSPAETDDEAVAPAEAVVSPTAEDTPAAEAEEMATSEEDEAPALDDWPLWVIEESGDAATPSGDLQPLDLTQ